MVRPSLHFTLSLSRRVCIERAVSFLELVKKKCQWFFYVFRWEWDGVFQHYRGRRPNHTEKFVVVVVFGKWVQTISASYHLNINKIHFLIKLKISVLCSKDRVIRLNDPNAVDLSEFQAVPKAELLLPNPKVCFGDDSRRIQLIRMSTSPNWFVLVIDSVKIHQLSFQRFFRILSNAFT